MTRKQLRQTLELALNDRAPKAKAQMQASGELAPFLDSLTSSTMQSMSAAKEQIGAQAASRQPPYQNEATLVPMLNSAFKAAEETALAQAIEQIDSLDSPSQQPETTAFPMET